MTYCLALRLDDGLVFVSDTRTNAGVDNVGIYRKLHVIQPSADRVFVLQSAGNLATTQQVLDQIQRDLVTGGDHESLATVNYLFEAALYVGRLNQEVSHQHRAAFGNPGDSTATFILGGQIGSSPPDILLVYPEGNYIRASDDRPFLQIGESKYGKFMLEIAVTAQVDLETATKVGLGSMMSTTRANLSVGPPYDVAVSPAGSLHVEELRVSADSPLLQQLQQVWEKHVLAAVAELPSITTDDLDIPAQDRPGSGASDRMLPLRS